MAKPEFDIQIDDAAAQALLAQIMQRGSDLRPVMRPISEDLLDGIEQAFEEERDPTTGEPWADLSALTIEAREKAGNWPGKILQRSGQLAASMSASYGSDFAAAGTNLAYAPTHQFGAKKGAFGTTSRGSPIPWADIPARPFAGISEETMASIADRLQRFLLGT
jgi:phage virion morphogenesis protein